jgi:tRNA modification GTPase
MFSTTDTIAAIATPAGRGGIGVIRISGPSAQMVGCAVVDRATPLRPRHATFARVHLDAALGAVGDQVVLTLFPAPHSYTSEDVVEISAHGSPVVLAAILDACVRKGARLAAPGEFTFRAYLHGRIELTQAEAVADLIESVTPLQARIAFDQLEGTLATAICRTSEALLDLTARLEASLDFPDEAYHFIRPGELASEIERIRIDVRALLARADEGRVIREGRRVVIAGPVNAGKSSLFNRLTNADRAIVAGLPGTTRDLLVERVDIAGVPVTLVDTAGLRRPSDEVEAEGVRRAEAAAEGAAVTVLVLDRSRALDPEHQGLLSRWPHDALVPVANKCDLPAAWSVADVMPGTWCETSAQTGEGLESLRLAIAAALGRQSDEDDPPRVTNVRHLTALREVDSRLTALLNDLNNTQLELPEDVVLSELTAARFVLEGISGARTPEDVLVHIFSRFCVGK